jgi:acyl-CoA reductase-like NAD-dependent aldehyde dehydrogenase
LSFLIAWPDLERAARLVQARHAELDGNLYEILSPAGEALEARHPLAATLARRAMIDFTLTEARSKRYPHAARHLDECAGLAPRIEDFAGHPGHEDYVRRLKSAHGRKVGFWQAVRPPA